MCFEKIVHGIHNSEKPLYLFCFLLVYMYTYLFYKVNALIISKYDHPIQKKGFMHFYGVHAMCIDFNTVEVIFYVSFLSLYYFAYIKSRGHNRETSADSGVSL